LQCGFGVGQPSWSTSLQKLFNIPKKAFAYTSFVNHVSAKGTMRRCFRCSLQPSL
jgi:hypothetical protein